jgi:alkylhydroperoxidase family enzyme
LRALIDNPAGGTLAGREREAARFCEKLSRTPGTIARADVDALRAVGFDDPEIVTIVAASSFANYGGRIAAGLGVRPEAYLSPDAQRAI